MIGLVRAAGRHTDIIGLFRLERLLGAIFFADGHETGHLLFGNLYLPAAPCGLAYIGYFVSSVPELTGLKEILSSEGHPGGDMINLFIMFLIVYLMLRLDFEKLVSRGKKASPEEPKPSILFKCDACGWKTDDINTEFCGECGRQITGMESIESETEQPLESNG